MHKLVAYQIRTATGQDGGVDLGKLVQLMERTYEEFDRERRLTDRANNLMEEELKEANAQVRHLGEQRLADALDSMPSAILLLDSAERIQCVNVAMRKLCVPFACPPTPGEDFKTFFAPLVPEAAPQLCVMLSGTPTELQLGAHWYLAIAHRFQDRSYAVTLSDITALKEREMLLALAKESAESANQMKSQFLATMSHELRTPLNAILGFSEMIATQLLGRDEVAWARYCEYAKAIHSSGHHLRNLITEVLDLSKIDSGNHKLTIESCDMIAIIEDSLILVQPQASRGNVRILPIRQVGDQRVDADGHALKQVLVNLLSNAVKFTRGGGEVEVITVGDSEHLIVTVRDTGIGIAPEHLKSVFEPFHQGDAKVARSYEGTGLGLSIVKGLIDMHGGNIALESTLGVGTSISFRIHKLKAAREKKRNV